MNPLAGKPAPRSLLVNVPRLVSAYYTHIPDPNNPQDLVVFGTSGHRGSPLKGTFNEPHILAIAQALCEYRANAGTTGPLFLGMDTHALSEPARATALEVFAANGIEVMIADDLGYTPTPVISHAILAYNKGHTESLADGVVISPSHNPPDDGGFKYNPPSGGPADTHITQAVQERANALLLGKLAGVKRVPLRVALASHTTHKYDFVTPYVNDLEQVVDMQAIAGAGVQIGVDPLGGASVHYWPRIAERYNLNLQVVNDVVDPTFAFMTVDHDGKIRMDCSSPDAMAGLIGLKDSYDIAFACDPDADRHGIVTPTSGLMNPNHYLAVAVQYLFARRAQWPQTAGVGKTLVSSALIDRVAKASNRTLVEVPVGFKYFVDGLGYGTLGFGGEESAGASFLRRDGTAWTTDKDGLILGLLAAEITAVTGKDPGAHYAELSTQLGSPVYARLDAPANAAQQAVLKSLSPAQVTTDTLAGEPIVAKLTRAPGNDAPIGGLKVATENGWFAARPSGTEPIYKIYAESFLGPEHLARIQTEAQAIAQAAFAAAGA